MVDKFTELTSRILKVLNVEYDGPHSRVYGTYNNENRYVNVFNFQDTSIKLHISEVYAQKGYVRVFDTGIATDKIGIYNIISLYIDNIHKIFNKHLIYARYRVLSIDNSAITIVDELLNYSEEELKLYISLL